LFQARQGKSLQPVPRASGVLSSWTVERVCGDMHTGVESDSPEQKIWGELWRWGGKIAELLLFHISIVLAFCPEQRLFFQTIGLTDAQTALRVSAMRGLAMF
jgi:hypothetical protein